LLSGSLRILLELVQWLIFARVIVSWLPIDKSNQFIVFLYQITEPILAPIRKLISKSSMGSGLMVDFSPIIAFLLISFLMRML
jgi:YggT family protein